MVCTFFGHKDTPETIYPDLLRGMEELITAREVSRFLVGNQGAFDAMVLKALRELKQKYAHISYDVVLAYIPSARRGNEPFDPIETIIPEGIETVPRRFAISWRNRWMVKESDMVVCYVIRTQGGAAQFAEYAKKQGKEVIFLSPPCPFAQDCTSFGFPKNE